MVAIDGAAGTGKSTLARSLARELRLPYVNTGLMYRALTALAIAQGVHAADGEALAELIGRLRFTMTGEDPRELEVEGYPPEALVSTDVESTVSDVSAHPPVRARLREIQRAMGRSGGAVMEGRDIGSVVFPDARVKLFLIADPAVRTGRRIVERVTAPSATAAELASRDERDAATNPLEPAEGAVVLDTGDADPQVVLARAMAVVRDRAPELFP